ncbi:MAG: PAS domain-containing protein, partial [Alphaproteobacteria bacterium]|nr:PAS domain-containing protein [Alphaproteobacteria bacterium]
MQVSRLLSPNIWPFGRTPEPDAGHRIPAAADEAARTQIEALVAALPDPVLLVDGDGLVLAANARMRAALDTDPVGHHLSTSIRTPALLDAVAEATSVSAGSNVEHEIRVPVPRSFDVTVSPLARDGRTGPAAVLVFKDLTREQQIERMRADFVANASHE